MKLPPPPAPMITAMKDTITVTTATIINSITLTLRCPAEPGLEGSSHQFGGDASRLAFREHLGMRV